MGSVVTIAALTRMTPGPVGRNRQWLNRLLLAQRMDRVS